VCAWSTTIPSGSIDYFLISQNISILYHILGKTSRRT